MWNRRRFLEAASGLPLLGGLAGSFGWAAGVRGEAPAAMSAPDYFRELGVRPFINAAGTYTAMTASLMPPEVMDAINYASKHYVMLDELQLKVGERIAKLVQAEAAMVTSGAASALTLGTAAVLTGTDQQKMVDLPDLDQHEERGHHPEIPPLRLRPCRSQLRRAAGRGRDAGGAGAGGQPEDRHDALLQQQQQGGPDPGRGVRPAREEALRFPRSTTPPPTCRRSRTCGSTRRWASTWWRSPAARASAARRAPACCSAARTSSPRPASTRRPTATRSAAG